jgi:hypothetical protein
VKLLSYLVRILRLFKEINDYLVNYRAAVRVENPVAIESSSSAFKSARHQRENLDNQINNIIFDSMDDNS